MSMNVSGLQTLTTSANQLTQPKKENNIKFEDIFNKAMDFIDETNQLQKNADNITLDFAAGKVDSIHDVMIAQDKAITALQFTVEIRDQLLEAYREIMRIQV